jgi:hypothetical protein
MLSYVKKIVFKYFRSVVASGSASLNARTSEKL